MVEMRFVCSDMRSITCRDMHDGFMNHNNLNLIIEMLKIIVEKYIEMFNNKFW